MAILVDSGQHKKVISYLPLFENSRLNLPDTLKGKLYSQTGISFYQLYEFQKAETNFNTALTYLQRGYTYNHTLIAKTLSNLGLVQNRLGKLQESLSNHFKSLNIGKEIYGDTSVKLSSNYINLGNTYEDMGEFESALQYQTLALEILVDSLGEYNSETGYCYNNIGNIFRAKREQGKAIEYHEKALRSRDNKQDSAGSYLNLGICYGAKGEYKQGMKFYEKSLRLFKQAMGDESRYVAMVLSYMADYYYTIGDLNKVLGCYLKSQSIKIKLYGNEDPDVARGYSFIGNVQSELGNYEESDKYYQKALRIYEKFKGQSDAGWLNNYLGQFHYNVAFSQIRRGLFDEAIQNLLLSKNYYEDYLGKDNYELVDIYFLLGGAYIEQRDYTLAKGYATKSLELVNSYPDARNIDISGSHRLLGQVEAVLGNRNEAMRHHDDAIKVLPRDSLLPYSEHPIYLIDAYGSKGISYHQLYIQRGLKADLDSCLEALTTAEQSFHQIKKSVTDFSSFQALYVNIIPYFEYLAKAHLHKFEHTNLNHHLTLAFQYAEKLKSLRLDYEAQRNIPFIEDVDPELRDQEFQLKTDIAYYEKKRFHQQYETPNPNDSLITVYQNRIFDLKQEREKLFETLERNYPDYWNLKYNFAVASVEEVQQQLLEDQALIEYLSTDSSIFLFTLTSDTFAIQEVKSDFPLSQWVQDMRMGIFAHNPATTLSSAQIDSLNHQYFQRAWQLYEKLLLPIEPIISSYEKLLIVPDGPLGYLPFDALLTRSIETNNSFRSLSYLIRNYQVSYAYSATLWLEMKNKKVHPQKHIAAFAPQFPKSPFEMKILANLNKQAIRDSLYELKYSQKEIKAVDSLMGASIFINKHATLSTFLKEARQYRILHLSTHGKADDRVGDYCFLAFTQTPDTTEIGELVENLLYARDLYNLNLNAEMVVLSACETGLGELQRGEGILSMGRGFTYAGAKSIISTLWSVNEVATLNIMELFYANLRTGMPKDEALRKAKLAYLDSPQEASPFYWAAFTANGDMSPIGGTTSHWKYYVLGLLFLTGLFWLFRKKLFSFSYS